MTTQLTHKAKLLAGRGLSAVLFGLAALWPGASLPKVALVFGIYALANGLWALITSWLDDNEFNHGWLLRLRGLASIAIGGLTCLWPHVAAPALVYLIVVWALLTGGLEAMIVFELRHGVERERRMAWNSLIQRQLTGNNPSERKMQRER